MEQTTRRGFVGASAALAAGTLAMVGTSVKDARALPLELVEWNQEADVVIMGFGGAGATAAIEAADHGLDVILLEKAPEDFCGGNTSVSGGGSAIPTEATRDLAFKMYRFEMPDTISDEEIEGLVNDGLGLYPWFEAHGAPVSYSESEKGGSMYAHHEYAHGLNGSMRLGGNGAALFAWLKETVESYPNITIEYETPVTKLVFDPVTKEVFGVVAQCGDQTLNIKARRGVVMACGGFENNHEMMTAYYAPEVPIFPIGTPYNTGDGLPMVMEIGAKVRGFSPIEWGCHCCKKGSEEIGVALGLAFRDRFAWDGAIMVNDQGKRFVNEIGYVIPGLDNVLRPLHDKAQLPELAFDMGPLRYTNLPMFCVFDENRRVQGPLMTGAADTATYCWAYMKDVYTWSDDNSEEIARGWIEQADTIEELAEKIGVDPEGLKATIEAYNASCAAGEGDEFGRIDFLAPIAQPPFYATELALSIINTQGGPARDAEHRVLGWDEKPIPRLYAAGEFGSIFTFLYQGSGNVPESLCGLYAGRGAANETPWC